MKCTKETAQNDSTLQELFTCRYAKIFFFQSSQCHQMLEARSVLRASERKRCRSGDGTRSDSDELKSQWRPSQSRKESILNCLLMGRCYLIYTNEWEIGSRWWDREISDLLEEGRILVGNKCRSESNGSLFRWTYYNTWMEIVTNEPLGTQCCPTWVAVCRT